MSGYADPDIKKTSRYLKIESGTPEDLRLLNPQPAESFEHFTPAGSVECKGEDECQACQGGDDAQQKFTTNVWSFSAQKVRIWKYGTGIAKQLKEVAISLQEEGKSIMDVDLKVVAAGEKKTKKYTITPRLTSKEIPAGLKLYDLNEIPF